MLRCEKHKKESAKKLLRARSLHALPHGALVVDAALLALSERHARVRVVEHGRVDRRREVAERRVGANYMHSDAASQGGSWWQGLAYIVKEPVGTPLTLPLELPLTKV